ncbi:MAG: M20 family metallopeptidase [Candidatus Bipolaricaulia bacterium]
MDARKDIDRALAQIQPNELVELTRALIRIPSVVRADGSEHEGKVAAFVAEKLRALGFDRVETMEVHPDRPNVIGIMEGSRPGKTILLEGHTDVVSEGDPDEWMDPPFAAVVKDHRIYGRGACDTKNNLASAMLAIAALRRAKIDFPGRIVLAVPVDEEGMMTGIKALIEAGHADGVDGALICEPEDNQLCATQKGALRAIVTSQGKMSHGCMPLTGFNATIPMARILLRLKEFEKTEIERLGYHKFLGFPSVTPTVVQSPAKGEGQLNVQPKDCMAYLDIRTIPGQDHGELKRSLSKIVAEVEAETRMDLEKGFEGKVRKTLAAHEKLPAGIAYAATIEFIEDRPWTETPVDDPIVRATAEAVRIITGKEPIYNGVPGATDGTFLFARKQIPILTTGSGDRMVPHQKDEWVSIDQLVETTRIYAATILLFLSGGEGR